MSNLSNLGKRRLNPEEPIPNNPFYAENNGDALIETINGPVAIPGAQIQNDRLVIEFRDIVGGLDFGMF